MSRSRSSSGPPAADTWTTLIARGRLSLLGVVDLLEAVEDQVEAELERADVVQRAFGQVLLGVFVQIRVLVGGNHPLERPDEVRDRLRVVAVTRLPQREAEDVCVEDVVGVVRRLG